MAMRPIPPGPQLRWDSEPGFTRGYDAAGTTAQQLGAAAEETPFRVSI